MFTTQGPYYFWRDFPDLFLNLIAESYSNFVAVTTCLVRNVIPFDLTEVKNTRIDIMHHCVLEDVLKVKSVWNCIQLQRLNRKAIK